MLVTISSILRRSSNDGLAEWSIMEPQKSIVLPIVMSVVLSGFIFGGLGYYLANSQNEATPTTTATPTASATAKPTTAPSTATSETANWKMVTNTKHGYTAKYPDKDWFVYGEAGKDESQLTVADTLSFSRNNADDRSHLIEVNSESLTSKIAELESFLKRETNYKQTAISFAGQSATQITYTDVFENKTRYDLKDIIFTHDGKTYYLGFTTKDYVKIGGIDAGNGDLILSTFSFTQ